MFSQSKGVIRLGDSTSHGGKVISVNPASKMKAQGIAAAFEGDMTHCPKCKGNFAILPSGHGKKHAGKWAAYEGTATACGATLVSSVAK